MQICDHHEVIDNKVVDLDFEQTTACNKDTAFEKMQCNKLLSKFNGT